jgi:hypothetical protein
MCRRAKITYGAVVVSIICTCAVYHLHVLIKDFHFGLLFQFFWSIWDCGVRSTATTKIHDITTEPRIPHSFGYHEIAPAFSTSSKFFLLFLTLDSFLVDPRLLFFRGREFSHKPLVLLLRCFGWILEENADRKKGLFCGRHRARTTTKGLEYGILRQL